MDSTRGVRIALEGCGHGKLHDIYAKVKESATAKGWDGVDLVIIGGDFQSVRNSNDLNGMSVPTHYRQIGDFHEYYSGKATAPYLTLFIGGNHEASNYLFELYYGGWVAPNIYYMGAANVLRFGPLRIAGLSGIWKGYDYQKPHFERVPYNEDDVKTIYHVRELDVRKLLQVRTQVDMGMSHDWPRGVELCGNYNHLFKAKPFFRQDSETGKLGSTAAKYVMDRLRPPYWFSAHLHVRYTALVTHAEYRHHKADQSANKRKVWTAQGMDGTTDEVRESPATRSGAFSVPQRPAPAQAIQAWNNFSVVAAEQEEVDHAEFLKQQSQKDENLSLNLESISSTFKQVTADDFGRKILKTETSVAQEPLVVKNSDEIDLDLDSENEWVEAAVEATKVDQGKADNSVDAAHQTEMQVAGEVQQPDQGSKEEPSQEASVTTEKSDIVPEAIRSQLPDAFKHPIHEKPVFGPLPEAIQNKVTNFLALGKCEDKVACHEYIDLMEVFAHNKDLDTKPPFSLQYDKEWLAITRVFADSLELGNPKAQLPSDQGDENYKAQIEKEEEWVQEHIVDKGKLVIPHNFELTAPVYDPNVPIQTLEMPQEYSNPQTSAFCELLEIKNRFHQSPSEREQRMLAGPRPSRGSTGHSRWQRRGANNGGGRGRGGRGRGRGGRGGHGGSFH